MIIKEAIQIGNKLLRAKNKKVVDFKSNETKRVIKNLVDSMRHHKLVGMAGPQIGENVRIFVSEITKTPTRKNSDLDDLKIYINPTITWFSNKLTKGHEGCGSVAFANLFGIVKRPTEVIVEAYNEKGEKFSLKAKGLLARIIQHEYDHINGIEFTDKSDNKTYMSRNEYIQKFSK